MFQYYVPPPVLFIPPVSDNDIFIKNISQGATPGPPGPQGPAGPPGPPGPENSCKLETILVTKDYSVLEDDCYIGVKVTKATNIILPSTPVEGKLYIIKLEMSPPVGNRKVTLKGNGSQIDGKSSIILENAHECITIIYRGDSWHIISQYK